MAIKIIEEPGGDVYLTPSEYARLHAEYEKNFMFYAGTPPSFERWVKDRGHGYRRQPVSETSCP